MAIFTRHACDALAAWYRARRRKPLIIRGARQVGKSTLVRQFAEREGLALVEINLERHRDLDPVFRANRPDRILQEIRVLAGRNPLEPGCVLFLDEIQAVPSAIGSLRYLYEDEPELPILAAGSLLEFALADRHFPMPVGRIAYLFLGPLSFDEYVRARGRADLACLMSSWSPPGGMALSAHRLLGELQREYLYVGGMPEAVASVVEENDPLASREVHLSIGQTFEDDFARYARGAGLMRIEKVYRQVPRLVGRRLKFVNIDRDERSADLKTALGLLVKAGIVTLVPHTSCSGIPLGAEVREDVFKPLFLDVGLMNALCRLDWRDISRLDEIELVNEGRIAEQFVGQHLLFRRGPRERPDLQYWQREGRKGQAEVDFVMSSGRLIIPVEVKAGASGSLKSLYQLVAKTGTPWAVRFDRNPPSLLPVTVQVPTPGGIESVSVSLLNLPLYLVGQVMRVLDEVRERRPGSGEEPGRPTGSRADS